MAKISSDGALVSDDEDEEELFPGDDDFKRWVLPSN
jgi:hypothetical protein